MKKYFVLSVVVLMTFALNTGNVFAKAEKTEFTGYRTNLSILLCGAQWYTGNDLEFTHFRNRVMKADIVVDDPLDLDKDPVQGILTVYINSNYQKVEPFDKGRIWGSFIIEPADYVTPFDIPVLPPSECQKELSVWFGKLTGWIVPDGLWGIKLVGRGIGEFKGQRIHIKFQNEDTAPTAPGMPPIPFRDWIMQGYILEP